MKRKGEVGVKLADVPYPTLKSGYVIARIKACGICGSDLHIYNNPRHPTPERVLGHEGSGIIVEVGDGVDDFVVGDRITYNPFAPKTNQFCGKCEFCLTGRPLGCPERILMSDGGSMAEYQQIHVDAVFKLPDNVPSEVGALIEPFNVAYHGVLDVSSLQTGQTIVILGPGTIGLCALIAAKLVNPNQIIMTGTSKDETVRFQVAKQLGVDLLINVEEEEPVERVKEVTSGIGVDVVIEAVGVPLLTQGLRMLKYGGEYVAIGHPHNNAITSIDGATYNAVIRKRKKILGSWIYDTSTWVNTISLLEQEMLDLEPLITHRLSLLDALKGFQLGIEQKCVKVILQP